METHRILDRTTWRILDGKGGRQESEETYRSQP